MKTKTEKCVEDPAAGRERYLRAKTDMTCDGCGERSIGKGMTYMEHTAEDGKSRMVLCSRCILAVKFRMASVGGEMVVEPGSLAFDRLPNRYQSAWTRMRQRLTKDIRVGEDKNEAWKRNINRLIDELGMRHIYERDLLLSEQAGRFDRKLSAIMKRVRGARSRVAGALDRMAKARLGIKTAMTRCQTGGCEACGMMDAAEAMDELAAAIVEARKALEEL